MIWNMGDADSCQLSGSSVLKRELLIIGRMGLGGFIRDNCSILSLCSFWTCF